MTSVSAAGYGGRIQKTCKSKGAVMYQLFPNMEENSGEFFDLQRYGAKKARELEAY